MDNRKLRYIASAVILSLTLSPLAEAKRIGGGGSRGMSRSNYSSTYSSPSYQYNRSNYANSSSSRLGGGNNAGMSRSYSNSERNDYRYGNNQNGYANQAQPRGNSTARVIGAGVAGAAIGALAGHAMANHNQQQPATTNATPASDYNNAANNVDNQTIPEANQQTQMAQPEKKSGFSWLWLLIIVIGGVYLYRRFAAKKNNQGNIPYNTQQNSNHFGTQNNSSNSARTNIFGQNLSNNSSVMPNNFSGMADGSNTEAFLRFARQRFNHVQSMNNASNLEEIRRYFTPEMFAAMRDDIIQNQDTAEFSDLNAELVDSTQENGQYIASVRFSGLVSENLGSPQQPFSEVWHFVKPLSNQQEWLIAGIQQD